MKRVSFILFLFLTSCEDNVTTREQTPVLNEGGVVKTSRYSTKINEFEYKDHIYIYSRVRDGIAMSHAGHCSCNKPE
jgi:hypothetical protein